MSEKETVDPFAFTVVEDDGEVVIIEVSEEQYRRDIEAGLSDEETLRPGRHRFVRGGFLKRHPEFAAEVRKRALARDAETRGETSAGARTRNRRRRA